MSSSITEGTPVITRHVATIAPTDSSEPLRIAYTSASPPRSTLQKGLVLLIHGFPQTSYQYRHVIAPLSSAGYHVLAPDYRGAGHSSKPPSSPTAFLKSTIASDMNTLLNDLHIIQKVHIIGLDIGGMIAFAFASRYPERCESLIWGECPLPGTTVYAENLTEHAVKQFHFIFHCVPDLAEALVAGKERIYLQHFFDKISAVPDAIGKNDVDEYVRQFEKPGAMRCGMALYEAFQRDDVENKEWLSDKRGKNGKCRVRSMVLNGELSRHSDEADRIGAEVHGEGTWETGIVKGAGHYVTEENPDGFVSVVLEFIGRVQS